MAEQYNATLPSYGQILQALDELPVAVRAVRRMRGQSVRAAARDMDISFASLARFEVGELGYDSGTLRAILHWLGAASASDTERKATP